MRSVYLVANAGLPSSAAKIIILNTKFLVCNAQFLVFNAQYLVFDTKFIVFAHPTTSPASRKQSFSEKFFKIKFW